MMKHCVERLKKEKRVCGVTMPEPRAFAFTEMPFTRMRTESISTVFVGYTVCSISFIPNAHMSLRETNWSRIVSSMCSMWCFTRCALRMRTDIRFSSPFASASAFSTLT